MSVSEEKYCGSCSHFLGMGDWNLCCDINGDGEPSVLGHLCYENTPACKKYNPKISTNVVEPYDYFNETMNL